MAQAATVKTAPRPTTKKSSTPIYIWEAKTKQGEVKKGEMEAGDQKAVESRLISLGMTPTKVRKRGLLDSNISFGGGVVSRDILIFTRQFATMIDAGLPLVQCLDILGSQTENPAFRKVIFAIKTRVEGGSTFSDALRDHPKVFDELYVQLCAAGEVGGILDTILNRLAIYREKGEKLARKVKGAMTYPIAVVVIGVMVTAVLLLKVTPVFEAMFRDFGSALPAPTQFVVDLSAWLQSYIIHLLVGMAAAFFAFTAFYRNPKGREIFDKGILYAPLVGDLLRKIAVARFTRTLGTMISSGVPILDALDVTAKTAGNRTIEKGIQYVRAKISEGKNIAGPLAETKVFPSMVVQMINVGETTGALDAMLSKIADFYEDEVDTAVAGLLTLMEPVMIAFLGVIVGGIVIAMYLPIFDLISKLT